MYQIVGLINRLMYGNGEDRGQMVAQWHSQQSSHRLDKDYEDSFDDDDETDLFPTNLRLAILLSGKRKSGKDHISTQIANYVGHSRMRNLAILRIAAPIKREFARSNRLDLTRLLDSTEYKENFRQEMAEWSESYREREGWNCFLKQTIKEQRAKDKPIWILSDARRPCDIEYFETDPMFANTDIFKLKIEASEEARMSRGWRFTYGIDDRETECGLDSYTDWSLVVQNNFNDRKRELNESLKPVFDKIDSVFSELGI